jgi:hypothetical protein
MCNLGISGFWANAESNEGVQKEPYVILSVHNLQGIPDDVHMGLKNLLR